MIIVEGRLGRLSWNQNQVEPIRKLMLTKSKRFPQQTFQSAAFDRVSMFFGDAQSQAGSCQFISRGEDQQVLISDTLLAQVNPGKVAGRSNVL